MIQKQDGSVSRRAFLIAGSGAVTAIALNLRYGTKPVLAKAGSLKAVNIVEYSNSGNEIVPCDGSLISSKYGGNTRHEFRG